MNVLSLFDGMSCGRVALERAGINVSAYYASEIDKYAVQVSKNNYPDIIHIGDITKVSGSDLPKIDLLIGGSPCQGFSFAGKQLNFNDPRSALFFEYVRLLKELRPRYFLLENVCMKQEYMDIITNELGVEPILINSALVSAQSRKRLYWTNIPNVTQPRDKYIYLQDITEHAYTDRLKSYCIDANYYKGASLEQYLLKSRRQLVFDRPERVLSFGNGGQAQRIYCTNGKSTALSALGGGMGAKTGIYAVAQRGRYIIDGKRGDSKVDSMAGMTEQRLETTFNEKSNCLTSVQKDSLLLDVTDEDFVVRKLTPVECERLQTLPDNYTAGVSNTQRYKMLGNGWTVDVIVHILRGLYGEKSE